MNFVELVLLVVFWDALITSVWLPFGQKHPEWVGLAEGSSTLLLVVLAISSIAYVRTKNRLIGLVTLASIGFEVALIWTACLYK